ncbi:hypothetical protein C8Q77DRAFT_1154383 [Trametes polyzona]|nr:hypothetical protein C8Q77DRAFT_1154383 [Trametes polyzona]
MSCFTTPTATEFATFTTSSLSTSFSDSVSTLDPTVTTIQSVSCVPTTNGTVTSSSCSTVNSVSTIAGGTTTVQVPVVATVPITSSSPTATLFSTSCSSGGTPPPDTTATTTTVVITTAVPITVTFQSSFTSDGTVVFTSGTSTTVTTVETTSTSLVAPTGSSSSGSSNTDAIVGGAVGGAVGAVILGVVAWFLFRRRRKYDFDDDLFLHETVHDDRSQNVLRKNGEKQAMSIDAEPRPYTYGALSSAGPSSGPHTPSTENAPSATYGGPLPPPRPSPYQPMSGKGLPPPPRPVPVQSQSSYTTPSAYSTYPPMPSPPHTPAATASVSTLTASGVGHDQHHQLHVVNDYPPVLSPVPGVSSQSEKAQIYLHPDRGLTTVAERPDASGSSSYVPRRPPTPAGLGPMFSSPSPPNPQVQPTPQAVPQSADPARGPFVHQDAGRAPPANRASESDAPPAYTE